MIPINLYAPIGAGGLVVIAVLMIFTGRWVPSRVVRTWVPRHVYDEALTDRDLWRKLALEKNTQMHQLLIPTAQAAQIVFDAVDHVADNGGGGT